MGVFADMAKMCDYFDSLALKAAMRNVETVTGEDGKEEIRLRFQQRFTVRDITAKMTSKEGQ